MSREDALDPRLQFLHDRRTVSRLMAPGPDPDELTAMLAAADTAPDHGQLRPWRLLPLDDERRRRHSDGYAQAQRAVDDRPELVERAAAKPLRGPCAVLAFARTTPHPRVPAWEQLAAAAAAVHSLCLAATALGYGSAWRTGWFVERDEVRAAAGAATDERIIGIVHLGTPQPRGPERPA
jgi:nitroreductase